MYILSLPALLSCYGNLNFPKNDTLQKIVRTGTDTTKPKCLYQAILISN